MFNVPEFCRVKRPRPQVLPHLYLQDYLGFYHNFLVTQVSSEGFRPFRHGDRQAHPFHNRPVMVKDSAADSKVALLQSHLRLDNLRQREAFSVACGPSWEASP